MAWYLTRMKSIKEEEAITVHLSHRLALEAGLVAEVQEKILIVRQRGLTTDNMDQVNLVQDMTITGTKRGDGDKMVVVHIIQLFSITKRGDFCVGVILIAIGANATLFVSLTLSTYIALNSSIQTSYIASLLTSRCMIACRILAEPHNGYM